MSDELNTNLDRVPAQGIFGLAVRIQVVMILVSCLLGNWAGTDPWKLFHWSQESILLGVLGTLPMLGLMGLLPLLPFKEFQEMRDFLVQSLGPMISKTNWIKLLMLALLVGLGEEMLFRGVLQPWLFTLMIPLNAIILSSLLFGLVHAVSTAYVITVFLISLYLGYSAIFLGDGTAHNLVPPVLMHSLYDFIAFLIIGRAYRKDYANLPLMPVNTAMVDEEQLEINEKHPDEE